MLLAKIKRKSQVTVPVDIMKKVGLQPGDFLEFIVEGDEIKLYPKRLLHSATQQTLPMKPEIAPKRTHQGLCNADLM